MEEEILTRLDNSKLLEKLYRENRNEFKEVFNRLYSELHDTKVADFWYERLNYQESEISWGKTGELIFVTFLSLSAGLIAQIPDYFGINSDLFYPRNIGFIVFPWLLIYFFWKNSIHLKKIIVVGLLVLASLIFINLFPYEMKSDTLKLSCIHLPLFLWSLIGFAFVGSKIYDYKRRIDFLRFNGDLIVLNTIILIAGAILTGLTVGLFSLIEFEISEFYRKNIVIFGLAAAPIFATYVIQKNPQLVKKVSPVIERIFSPLVLITLVTYLVAIIYSGKDPYNNREFLLTFNALLIGVMTIILFSVVETSKTKNKIQTYILFLLSIVTIIVNGVALSAILFRISEWGITPNRLAVLGGNILILTNLLIVTYKLFRTVRNKSAIDEIERSIAAFLPVYSIWTIIVTFVFPIIFWFK